MKQFPHIQVTAYHRGQKKVLKRDDANHVTYLFDEGYGMEYFTFNKSIYDTIKDKKPTEVWNELPETV